MNLNPATMLPVDELERLNALRSYNILDTPPDGAFDRITELVAELMNVPVAIVSLVDHDRIWFKSHYGVEATQIDRDPGLCASAILGKGMYEVNDAALDPRTLSNPLVAGSMGVRFYAGHPLRTPEGHNLGMLCALDFEPREVSERDRQILETLAGLVMDQMNLRLSARRVHELNTDLARLHEELRHEVMHDSLTGLWNRGAVLGFLTQSLSRSRRSGRPVTALMIDVDLFKTVNDTYGHAAGDQVLAETARRLSGALRNSDSIGRLGGEEFLVVLDEAGASDSVQIAERLRRSVCDEPYQVVTGQGVVSVRITVSVGAHSTDAILDLPPHHVLSRADAALYMAKQRGRNRVELG